MFAGFISIVLMARPVSANDAFLARMIASRDAVTKLAFDPDRGFPEGGCRNYGVHAL